MEPITTVLLATIIWDNFGQPILDSAKGEYGNKVLNGLIESLPFKKEDNEIIEAEIIEALETKKITNKDNFIDFLDTNDTFINSLLALKKLSSHTEIINSFKRISDSSVKVNGKEKKIVKSFNDICNSNIEM